MGNDAHDDHFDGSFELKVSVYHNYKATILSLPSGIFGHHWHF